MSQPGTRLLKQEQYDAIAERWLEHIHDDSVSLYMSPVWQQSRGDDTAPGHLAVGIDGIVYIDVLVDMVLQEIKEGVATVSGPFDASSIDIPPVGGNITSAVVYDTTSRACQLCGHLSNSHDFETVYADHDIWWCSECPYGMREHVMVWAEGEHPIVAHFEEGV